MIERPTGAFRNGPIRNGEIRLALRRVGLRPYGWRDPGDWLAEDPPTWLWMTDRNRKIRT